jgi:hypothetical protein
VQQRSNDVRALAMRRGVRMLNVDVSTIEQNVGVSTMALVDRKQFPNGKINSDFV